MKGQLIREVAIRYVGTARRAPKSIRRPDQVAAYMRKRVRDDALEHFVAIYLDGRHAPIADRVLSVGTATQSLVHPREVYQPAVGLGACGIIVAHNHPSGDPNPSREDIEITTRLAQAGGILGIALLDHVIWSRDGSHYSIREANPEAFDV